MDWEVNCKYSSETTFGPSRKHVIKREYNASMPCKVAIDPRTKRMLEGSEDSTFSATYNYDYINLFY